MLQIVISNKCKKDLKRAKKRGLNWMSSSPSSICFSVKRRCPLATATMRSRRTKQV